MEVANVVLVALLSLMGIGCIYFEISIARLKSLIEYRQKEAVLHLGVLNAKLQELIRDSNERFHKQITVNANAFTEQVENLKGKVHQIDLGTGKAFSMVSDFLDVEIVDEPSKTYLRAKKSKK